MKNGKFITKNWTKKIYGNEKWTAIQLTTATGVCIMIEAHRSNAISHSGFVKQESIDYKDFDRIDTINYRGIYS